MVVPSANPLLANGIPAVAAPIRTDRTDRTDPASMRTGVPQ